MRRIVVASNIYAKKHNLSRVEKKILKSNPELMGALRMDQLNSSSRKWREKIMAPTVPSGLEYEMVNLGGMFRVNRIN
jgi:hypothetical protein